MLGAQARAAEYNAPKNLSARQASREAEEQKLPPKPAPISLGAFTRNPSVNRNKGTKHYVPLILSEKDEDEDTTLEETQSTVSSKEPSAPSEPKDSTPSAPRSTTSSRIKVSLPRNPAIPIAPRAMRFPGPTAMPPAQMTQLPMAPQPQPHDNHGFIPMALYPGQPGPQTVGMYPYPHYGWVAHSHIVDQAGRPIDVTPEGMRRIGPMMAPTDMTPTKQEQKLTMMSHAYRNPLYAAAPAQLPVYDHSMMPQPHYAPQPYVEAPMTGYTSHVEYGPQPYLPAPAIPLHHPQLHHSQSDFEPEPRTAIYDPRVTLDRHNSAPDSSVAPSTPPRSMNNLIPAQAQSILRGQENEEPYDRNLNVQKFLSQPQQTGKTVLHNPDLHKSQASQPVDDKESEDEIDTPSKPPPTESKPETVRAAPEKPPGLEEVTSVTNFDHFVPKSSPKFHDNTAKDEMLRDALLQDFFGVGSDDWFDLRPATKFDRHAMQSVLTSVALDLESPNPLSISSISLDEQRKQTEVWLHTDPRGMPEVRKEVDRISDEYSVKSKSRASDSDETTATSLSDVEVGLLRGSGHIMTTLAEYAAENSKKTDDSFQDYFNRTKKVPEYAIERREASDGSSVSLFEKEGSGFYNAPNRIARDPRYRVPSRGETSDRWAAPRYDVFGRRKV
jgi:hypothetical protein